MLKDKINLEEELRKLQSVKTGKSILKTVNDWLLLESANEERIRSSIHGNSISESFSTPLNFPVENVFTLGQIRLICIKYRLRFLETKRFKGTIPYAAIQKVKEAEKVLGKEINNFKIIAPSELFTLDDPNKDPLLFADLGNGKYLLIHSWGKDLSWWRPLLAYPFRDIESLLKTILGFSLLLSCLIPNHWLVTSPKLYENIFYFRALFFGYAFIGIFFTLIFFGFTFRKNFSIEDWNSRLTN
jgi:hypothetical protein